MKRLFSLIVFCLLAFLGWAGKATAGDDDGLPTYEVDSLVYRSSNVVEAKVIRGLHGEERRFLEVSVIKVYKGNWQADKSVLLDGMNAHRVIEPSRKTRECVPGDVLFLFSNPPPAPVGNGNQSPGKRDGAETTALSEETVVIVEGKLSALYWLPPPNACLSFPGPAGWELPGPEAFRQQIAASVPRTAAWERLFRQAPVAQDVDWLLPLVRERSKLREEPGYDSIAELACERLAKIQAVPAMAEALGLPLAPQSYQAMYPAMANPAGYDLLLKKIGSAEEPMARRLHYAGIAIFDRGKGDYLARLAELALANRQHEDLCLRLLESLGYLGGRVIAQQDDVARADLVKGLPSLNELYRSTTSEKIKFELEFMASESEPSPLHALETYHGPVLSLAVPGQPDDRSFVAVDGPALRIRHRAAAIETGASDQTVVVLRDVATGKTYLLPTPLKAEIKLHWIMADSVPLPKDLPKGKYRVCYQFLLKEKVVYEGRAFETEL